MGTPWALCNPQSQFACGEPPKRCSRNGWQRSEVLGRLSYTYPSLGRGRKKPGSLGCGGEAERSYGDLEQGGEGHRKLPGPDQSF